MRNINQRCNLGVPYTLNPKLHGYVGGRGGGDVVRGTRVVVYLRALGPSSVTGEPQPPHLCVRWL